MRPTPKEFFTMDYLRRRRDDKPPPFLFHWTRTLDTARSILSSGQILGHPTVHLTENPALIEAGSIGWLIDTTALLRLGFHLYPTQSRNWPHEAEWTVGAASSERLGVGGEADSAIWSSQVRLPLGDVTRKMLVREHMLRRHPDMMHEFGRIYQWGPVAVFEWDDWWEREPLPVARNPLLAKPPGRFHRLQDTRRYRKLIGHAPRDEDYDGVHTSSDDLIAAAYAMGTWSQASDQTASYPVLVTLDVSELTPLPDVDATLRGAEAADDLLPSYRKLVREEDWTLDNFIEDDDYREADVGVGEPPAAFIFEDTGHHVAQAIRDYAEAEGTDENEVFDAFIKTGSLPAGVLTRMVQQQRYLNDFDTDRVVRIQAVKPWWHQVLLGGDEGKEDEKIDKLEARGFRVFSLDDWPFSLRRGDLFTLYEAPDAEERENAEYHGTTSAVIEVAFPGLIPDTTPFPIEEEES
jgi:hypothetical protein